jgi:hypothetical protein
MAILAAAASTPDSPGSVRPAPDARLPVIAGYGKLPLHFEANQGQTQDQVKFLARGSGYGLFLTPTESVLVLRKTKAAEPRDSVTGRDGAVARPSEPRAVLRMKLLGANPRPVVAGREELPGKSNYFIGNDPKNWRTNVPQYARVELRDVYPGVDLTYYGNQGQIEYDFIVSPGADPRQIRFGIEGAEKLSVNAEGNLLLTLPGGEVVQRPPEIYQDVDGGRRAIDGRFVLTGAREVGFEVGAYERSRPLVLDPLLVYSTYLGGSAQDEGQAITVDTSGSAYITGVTESNDFPTANPMQAANAGGRDVFVAKLSASGSGLVYSTYLGGSGWDQGMGIALDESGNVYVTGLTDSIDFPTVNPFQAARGAGVNAFVAKLNAAGSALVYSTYLGGNGNDHGYGIAVDASGSAYLTGMTSSNNFPTANPLQGSNGGGVDAFVAKLSPAGSALVYSTYLGGRDEDVGFGISVDASGNACLVGHTRSTNFPTANALQAVPGGAQNAFVAKLNAAGSALVFSTYLGGSGYEFGQGIAVDREGSVYITGETGSTNFPTVNPIQASPGGNADAFVAKLTPDGSALVYSTYLGGSYLDGGSGIAVDTWGNAYVTGYTNSSDFPTVNAIQAEGGARFDFVAKLNASGSALVYSTFLGGHNIQLWSAIAVDSSGNGYVTGQTNAVDFPTVNAFQASLAGHLNYSDAFVTKIGPTPPGDFNLDGKPDILWQNQANGRLEVWYMDGVIATGSAPLNPGQVGDLDWKIVGTADFNNDSRPDILWQNQSSGLLEVWYMDRETLTSAAPLNPSQVSDLSWQIVATGDFNGDGKPDILWQNQANGLLMVWYMDGATRASSAPLNPGQLSDPSWKIVGVADFNADGKPDILWQNQASGLLMVWYMDGVRQTGSAPLNPGQVRDLDWKIQAAADFNGDGKPDILWQHQGDGLLMVWYMDGATQTGSAALNPSQVSDPNWKIVGPR